MSAGHKRNHIAAVGMFDGVHRGHAYLLDSLRSAAAERGMVPLVLTFAHHPMSVLRPDDAPAILTSPGLRSQLIHNLGIAGVKVMDFGKQDFALTAAQFIEKIKCHYSTDALLMGFNNHIGSDRRTCADLIADGYDIIPATPCPDIDASSSLIREQIRKADFGKAEAMLGHRFTVRGTVVPGRRLGRTIGFPTANIQPEDASQLLPPDGVYAVDAHIGCTAYRGMANIGSRPTVGGHHRTFEVHIINFTGDIYGATLDIDFISRLRPERQFPSLEALTAQLALDRTIALAAK